MLLTEKAKKRILTEKWRYDPNRFNPIGNFLRENRDVDFESVLEFGKWFKAADWESTAVNHLNGDNFDSFKLFRKNVWEDRGAKRDDLRLEFIRKRAEVNDEKDLLKKQLIELKLKHKEEIKNLRLKIKSADTNRSKRCRELEIEEEDAKELIEKEVCLELAREFYSLYASEHESGVRKVVLSGSPNEMSDDYEMLRYRTLDSIDPKYGRSVREVIDELRGFGPGGDREYIDELNLSRLDEDGRFKVVEHEQKMASKEISSRTNGGAS